MTDEEEKAEEYAIKITDELRNKGFLTNEEINQRYAGIIQGVLYGLAEGKPKWHDLRKDPNDLPKHSGLYCVQCGEVREFVKEELSWFTVHFVPCMNCTEDTYAWCELPKFEEK